MRTRPSPTSSRLPTRGMPASVPADRRHPAPARRPEPGPTRPAGRACGAGWVPRSRPRRRGRVGGARLPRPAERPVARRLPADPARGARPSRRGQRAAHAPRGASWPGSSDCCSRWWSSSRSSTSGSSTSSAAGSISLSDTSYARERHRDDARLDRAHGGQSDRRRDRRRHRRPRRPHDVLGVPADPGRGRPTARWTLRAVAGLGAVWGLFWLVGAQLISHTPIAIDALRRASSSTRCARCRPTSTTRRCSPTRSSTTPSATRPASQLLTACGARTCCSCSSRPTASRRCRAASSRPRSTRR